MWSQPSGPLCTWSKVRVREAIGVAGLISRLAGVTHSHCTDMLLDVNKPSRVKWWPIWVAYRLVMTVLCHWWHHRLYFSAIHSAASIFNRCYKEFLTVNVITKWSPKAFICVKCSLLESKECWFRHFWLLGEWVSSSCLFITASCSSTSAHSWGTFLPRACSKMKSTICTWKRRLSMKAGQMTLRKHQRWENGHTSQMWKAERMSRWIAMSFYFLL